MIRLEPETPADADEVENLLDTAFAPGRSALSSYKLREGVDPIASLCTLARDESGALAGSIRYWPVRVGEAGHPALLLGPIAVHPVHQGEGLGALLIGETLDAAKTQGWTRVILVGDEPYYSRFGFSRASAAALEYPPPVNMNRLLAKELERDGMAGISGLVRKWSSNS